MAAPQKRLRTPLLRALYQYIFPDVKQYREQKMKIPGFSRNPGRAGREAAPACPEPSGVGLPSSGFDRRPSGKGRTRYSSPSAFIMSRERAKASTVASTSASPWVAEIVPPGQPVRSTPFTFIASLSFCAAPGALPRSSS